MKNLVLVFAGVLIINCSYTNVPDKCKISFVEYSFVLQDEEYIDDIPFDTKKIIEEYSGYCAGFYNESLDVDFQLEEEEYIDDIPFDTYEIVKSEKIMERYHTGIYLIKEIKII